MCVCVCLCVLPIVSGSWRRIQQNVAKFRGLSASTRWPVGVVSLTIAIQNVHVFIRLWIS